MLLIAFGAASMLPATTGLTVDKSVFDFGTIQEGANANVSFTIRNAGNESIQIKEIRTFAACVESKPLPKKDLKPAESMRLDYVFESLGYGGVTVDRKIEIYLTQPDSKPLTLYVRGKVLALEPFQAPFGELTYNFFVLIDLRSPAQFETEHIVGAINVPAAQMESWTKAIRSRLSDEVVIYAYSQDGVESDTIVRTLRKTGFGQYISLVGGLNEWKKQKGDRFLISGKQ